ncbi:hypothetical protein CA983_03130 [Streptomyces swartbergensis]|uniref:Uncharacterized protein n=1 Tax=Streptomyces swartbergensis TaxID=487165 RepID=A0A243SBC8_9ACTN|nr:hypothetical protein CA983_03130 [Streptomyces swartbergensis]
MPWPGRRPDARPSARRARPASAPAPPPGRLSAHPASQGRPGGTPRRGRPGASGSTVAPCCASPPLVHR